MNNYYRLLVTSASIFILCLASSAIASADKSKIADKIKTVKVPFISNQGQLDNNVSFYARTLGGSLFVTHNGVLVYNLPKIKVPDSEGDPDKGDVKYSGGVVLREQLVDARVSTITGRREAISKVSYFKGSDFSKWQSNIPTFEEVSLGEVYEGIEMRLKAYGSNVEKLFYVSPGADPDLINISISGADAITVLDSGELQVSTPLGNVNFTRPVAWQMINGSRKPVTVVYAIAKSAGETLIYGFKTDSYDTTQEVIIDPLLASTFVGGSGTDNIAGMAIDSSGNIFIAGSTDSSDYPTSTGAYDITYATGNKDVVVSKFNSDLSSLLASTYIGGTSADYCNALVLDASDNVFLTGYTFSTDFPTTTGAYNETHTGGSSDVFVSKLNADLTGLAASTFLGGSDQDEGNALGHVTGSLYVAGGTRSSNFPTIAGAYDTTHSSGNHDIFISRLQDDLTKLLNSTYLGGANIDIVTALVLDASSKVYITGFTESPDYPVTAGVLKGTLGGSRDMIVSVLNGTLSSLLVSTFFGGTDVDEGNNLLLDSSGYIYLTGVTLSSDYPTKAGAYDISHNGSGDVVVTRINSLANFLIASTFIGDIYYDKGSSLALDGTGNVLVTGTTQSGTYPVSADTYDSSFNGSIDILVSKFDSNLTTLQASTFVGGTSSDYGFAVAVGPSGNVYVAGETNSADFPTTTSAFDSGKNLNKDICITKLDANLSSAGEIEFALSSYSVSEGVGDATITVSRKNGSYGTVTIDYATISGSAQPDFDYTTSTGTLTWTDGDSTDKTFTVPIIDDTVYEGGVTGTDEFFSISLSNPGGSAVLGSLNSIDVTIVDNDPSPPAGTVQLTSATYSALQEGQLIRVYLTRTGGDWGDITVDFTLTEGSAKSGVDYTPPAYTTVQWLHQDSQDKKITIATIDDLVYEGELTFSIALSNLTGGAILGTQTTATLKIPDNESPAYGSVQFDSANYAVDENAAGPVTITVTRTGGSFGAVSVDYASAPIADPNPATAGTDYTAVSGTLNWTDSDTAAKTFTVAPIDDTDLEGNEVFQLVLSNPQGGTFVGGPATTLVTILDDETPQYGFLQFTSSTYNVTESGTATIGVSRINGTDGDVSIDFATANGTAIATEDYNESSGTLFWVNGVGGTQTFSVSTIDNTIIETDETVILTLSNPTGSATLGTPGSAVLTIADDDTPAVPVYLQFSTADYTAWEDDGIATITVVRTGGTAGEVTVDYATSDNTAVVGGDYDEKSGTLTWLAGDSTDKTFDITLINDAISEGIETLNLTLSNPTGGSSLSAPSTAVLTIRDDEALYGNLQFNSATYNIDEDGTGLVTITVTRSGGTVGAVSVDYATSDETASAGSDYTSTSGTLTWADGSGGPKTFSVPVINDADLEGTETFSLVLSNPQDGASTGNPSTTQVTIIDDDTPQIGTLQFDSASYIIKEDAAGPATITVTRTGGSDGIVSIDYATGNGTALAGFDYTSTSGTLTWGNGDSADKSFTVSIIVDPTIETDETVNLTLNNPTGGAALGNPVTSELTIREYVFSWNLFLPSIIINSTP